MYIIWIPHVEREPSIYQSTHSHPSPVPLTPPFCPLPSIQITSENWGQKGKTMNKSRNRALRISRYFLIGKRSYLSDGHGDSYVINANEHTAICPLKHTCYTICCSCTHLTNLYKPVNDLLLCLSQRLRTWFFWNDRSRFILPTDSQNHNLSTMAHLTFMF